jgi:hypothetical protein
MEKGLEQNMKPIRTEQCNRVGQLPELKTKLLPTLFEICGQA